MSFLLLLLAGCGGAPHSLVEGTLTGRVDGQAFDVAIRGNGKLGSDIHGPIISFDGKTKTTESPRELTGFHADINELPPKLLGAGPLSVESWFIDLGGLTTSSDHTDVSLVLDTTDATWLGENAAPFQSTGTLTGTIPLEDGAGEIALDATFTLVPECGSGSDPWCGRPDDEPATAWDAVFSPDSECPQALVEAALPPGPVTYEHHVLGFGELEMECVKTAAGRVCGVEQADIGAEGCSWKVLTVADPTLSTVLMAAFATPSCPLDPKTCFSFR
jgi:hypothetical protein